MIVGDICTQKVATALAFDELTAAARRMREKHIGYLVVVEPSVADGSMVPVGVITDRTS